MKTLLVDDHTLVREGLSLLLRSLRPDISVLQASSVDEGLDLIARQGPVDLILLDLQMPGMDDIDALRAMRAGADAVPIIVVSGNESPNIVHRCIEEGAAGFVQKSAEPSVVIPALKLVLVGGVYLPPMCLTEPAETPIATHAAKSASLRERLAEMGLSARQTDVLVKLVQGKSNKVIARELDIGEATVKTHAAAIFTALRVHSRAQVVYEIARLGLPLQSAEA